MQSRSSWSLTLALAALLPLAACAGGEEAADDAMMEEDTAGQMEEGAAMQQEEGMMEPVTVALEAKNESGVTGQATAAHHADSVTVAVQISGASGDGEYPAHVHSGTCASPGGVLAPLNPLAVAGGSGSSRTELVDSEVPRDQGAVIQVHDVDGNPVACADLAGHGEEMDGMGEGMEGGEMEGGEMEGGEMEGGSGGI